MNEKNGIHTDSDGLKTRQDDDPAWRCGMNVLYGDSANPKWLDARVFQPSSNSFDIYDVVYFSHDMTFTGRAGWIPDDGYKTGKWGKITNTNGNPQDGQVLYWRQNPSRKNISTIYEPKE